jgi:hypothetical protein
VTFHRLAKSKASAMYGVCPALYVDDDPAKMIAQGKILTSAQTARLSEVAGDETAVEIPTETVLRSIAKHATEQGDDELAARIEAFLIAREL